jgi:hypothetical protein
MLVFSLWPPGLGVWSPRMSICAIMRLCHACACVATRRLAEVVLHLAVAWLWLSQSGHSACCRSAAGHAIPLLLLPYVAAAAITLACTCVGSARLLKVIASASCPPDSFVSLSD